MKLYNIKKTIFTGFLFTFIISAYAQKLNGTATYKTATKFSMDMDSSSINAMVDHAAIQAQLSKAMQKEFTLNFNTYESNYKEVAELSDAPQASSGGVKVMVMGGGGSTYRNVKDLKEIESTDLFGKPFLINDLPEKPNWTIKNEIKQIGKYECQKAVFTREVKETSFTSEEANGIKEVTKQLQVVAWFAKDIPVNHGPDEYWGLPGLILEVNNGRTTIICTKVVLNPTPAVKIALPKGGKKISKEDYNSLREKKMDEMMNQYRGNDDGAVRIKIGG